MCFVFFFWEGKLRRWVPTRIPSRSDLNRSQVYCRWGHLPLENHVCTTNNSPVLGGWCDLEKLLVENTIEGSWLVLESSKDSSESPGRSSRNWIGGFLELFSKPTHKSSRAVPTAKKMQWANKTKLPTFRSSRQWTDQNVDPATFLPLRIYRTQWGSALTWSANFDCLWKFFFGPFRKPFLDDNLQSSTISTILSVMKWQ